MYVVELAYMVVAHSQRDPGEYLLELQRFAALGAGALQRHAIDMHLGRWHSALRHLAAAGAEHFLAALALARDKVTIGIVSCHPCTTRLPSRLFAAHCIWHGDGKQPPWIQR